MYLCWRKRRGFSRELVFKEEIDRKLCAFGNYWLVLKGTIFRLSGITAYSSFQKSSHCTEVSKLDWHKMLDPLISSRAFLASDGCKLFLSCSSWHGSYLGPDLSNRFVQVGGIFMCGG
ncbi:uncharacterized protein LOC127805981 isoform X3 [Diospyros lotus]|uniref:uncharacterized protein LOC127805981 isoform X3 n=1 Tax=Diospyros lotus TaxID=55363 RepID=UPI002254C849|nr:uncharacterized protein LOC127805981 isoform X3 [Diospyros lotus]